MFKSFTPSIFLTNLILKTVQPQDVNKDGNKMKNNIFQEFTLVHPETQTEVMVDISVNTGKVLDLYCYAKDIPAIYRNEETEKKYSISTKAGKNSLFVHIQQKAKVFSLLLNNGFICVTNEEDERYNDDIAIFEKCLSLYNINVQSLY